MEARATSGGCSSRHLGIDPRPTIQRSHRLPSGPALFPSLSTERPLHVYTLLYYTGYLSQPSIVSTFMSLLSTEHPLHVYTLLYYTGYLSSGGWGWGGGETDSLRLGTNCETTAPPPFLTEDSHLQIYSPLFSRIPKNSPLKSALSGNCLYCICHILANYCIKSFQEQI